MGVAADATPVEQPGLVQVEKDGVIDYPLYEGQTLQGVWQVTPTSTGQPAVTAQNGYLHYTSTAPHAHGEWLLVSINTPMQTALGCLLTFRLRATTILASDLAFRLPAGVILHVVRDRHEGYVYNWQYWDGSYHTLAASSITQNGDWHDITLDFTATTVTLFEDGVCLFTWQTAVGTQVSPRFDMQTDADALSFDIGEIYSVPSLFADGINTPWDFSFTEHVWPSEQAMTVTTAVTGPQISFGPGYARFAAMPMTGHDVWAFLDMPLVAPAVSILIYRIRVNVSDGEETKINLPGGNVLRVLNNGTASSWEWWDGTWHMLASSSIVAGQSDFTIVTLITSPTQMTLLENGVVTFQRSYTTVAETWNPGLAVQHWDAGTNVSVDIGGIRILPTIKTPALLAIDLQDELLAYFPLKGDLANAAGTSDPLGATGWTPTYVPGPFGLTASLAGQNVGFSLPRLPASTSPSYTLSVWVKVDGYPPDDKLTGIAGTLLLDSTGHVQFMFVYNNSRAYQEQRFSSVGVLSLGQWHNVVVTYSFEESRLGVFIDGVLDSIYYMANSVASASAIVPAMFYVGAYTTGFDQPLVVLNGAVGDLFFLTQHVHLPTVMMFANVWSSGDPANPQLTPLFAIAFLLLAAAVIRVGIEQVVLEQTEASASVNRIVTSIRSQVGVPARRGARVSRSQVGITRDDYPILLDIGGEGPLEVGGVVTGFPAAINVNAPLTQHDERPPTVSVIGPLYGRPIQNLVELEPWDTNPGYPFDNDFADQIAMIGAPLTDKNVKEMARVIRHGGTIDLWIDYEKYQDEATRLARQVNSVVEDVKEISRFRGNIQPWTGGGGKWFTHRRIVAHKRRVIFYATDFSNLAPLTECAKGGYITHVLIGLVHLGYDHQIKKTGPYVHLNNWDLSDSRYAPLWEAMANWQHLGVQVLASLGGGGVGDYTNLFATSGSYDTFYTLLKTGLQAHNFDGIDLDIEEADAHVNTKNVGKLVSDLKRDFGSRPGGFAITSAPVACALTGCQLRSPSPNVNYNELIDDFDFYILEFYNGFGNLNPRASGPHYSDVATAFPTRTAKLVAGVLTNKEDGGSGYNSLTALTNELANLVKAYPNFGGISGWTYQHALNAAGQIDPRGWAKAV